MDERSKRNSQDALLLILLDDEQLASGLRDHFSDLSLLQTWVMTPNGVLGGRTPFECVMERDLFLVSHALKAEQR